MAALAWTPSFAMPSSKKPEVARAHGNTSCNAQGARVWLTTAPGFTAINRVEKYWFVPSRTNSISSNPSAPRYLPQFQIVPVPRRERLFAIDFVNLSALQHLQIGALGKLAVRTSAAWARDGSSAMMARRAGAALDWARVVATANAPTRRAITMAGPIFIRCLKARWSKRDGPGCAGCQARDSDPRLTIQTGPQPAAHCPAHPPAPPPPGRRFANFVR